MQALLGGEEIYHYHSKLMMKDPRTGGAHVWHQDYGYWYNNGCLLPEMGSVFIPVDPCTKSNSCLQVLSGSHRMGRINHVLEGQQAGADSERFVISIKFSSGINNIINFVCRLKEALRVFPHVYVEMSPGDALFFHCNLLHSSDQNNSDQRRWVMITSYNKKKNNPVYQHHHPFYHPLNMVENKAILGGSTQESSSVDKAFLDPNHEPLASYQGSNRN